jgi:hypothetical protein
MFSRLILISMIEPLIFLPSIAHSEYHYGIVVETANSYKQCFGRRSFQLKPERRCIPKSIYELKRARLCTLRSLARFADLGYRLPGS